jgi:predicted TIM-barrel fold metal-dependent hydrolase
LIIDSHVHIGSPPKEAEPKNFAKLMKKSNIDKAIIFRLFYDKPTKASNQYTSLVVNQHPDLFIGFAWVNPNDKTAIKELKTSILKWNLNGVKLHLEMHPTPLKNLKKIFNITEKYKIPAITHLGDNFDQIETLSKEYKTKIIIAHLGTGVYNLDINRLQKAIILAKKENVFLETSGNTYPLVDYAVKNLNSKKILLGSDFPHEHPLISVKIIELLKLSKKEKEQILYKNVIKILEN